MSDNHKHRARIFLHRGDLIQARAAWEAAVADDRASNNQPDLSDSLGNLHIGAGTPGKARSYYLEALELLHTLTDDHALGILHNNLALQEAREGQ